MLIKQEKQTKEIVCVFKYSFFILYLLHLLYLGPHGAMKVIGLNPLLISDCVAYLKNPKHLREEGIFRIPGDLNQINLYHKQYDYCKCI